MAQTLQDFKAGLFKTLGNSVRIRILEVLRSGEDFTVSEIQQRVQIEPANLSQHLSIMRSHGLVTSRREGTSVRYAVAVPELLQLLDVARSIFEKQLAERTRVLESDREV